MNAIPNAKHTPAQLYSCGMCSYEYSNKAYILIFESAANCFSFALAGVNEYTESHDRKYTARRSVLSRPALHLVEACLSKPIWAYHCAPKENKQDPHAHTPKNTWQHVRSSFPRLVLKKAGHR